MRRIAASTIFLLVAAAPATPPLRSGLWEVESTPEAATLDGRKLAQLPYDPPPPQTICLSPADAADPARWFARDSAECSLSQRAVGNGQVAIAGTCPSPDSGKPRGTVRISGRYTATSYALRFATIVNGDNGRMGFDGTMTGKRVGDCPS
jgi:hypothetical protein